MLVFEAGGPVTDEDVIRAIKADREERTDRILRYRSFPENVHP